MGRTWNTVAAWRDQGAPISKGPAAVEKWAADRKAARTAAKAAAAPAPVSQLEQMRSVKRELAQLELDQARGRLVPVEAYRETMQALCVAIKDESRNMVEEAARRLNVDAVGMETLREARTAFLKRTAAAMERFQEDRKAGPAGGKVS